MGRAIGEDNKIAVYEYDAGLLLYGNALLARSILECVFGPGALSIFKVGVELYLYDGLPVRRR